MNWRALWLAVTALGLGACVELREPWEPELEELEATPGQDTVWDGADHGLPGYRLIIPGDAIESSQVFAVQVTYAASSPTTSQAYELVATAVTILPLDYEFLSPARLEIPRPQLGGIRSRVLWTIDEDHLRNFFWDFAEVATDVTSMSVAVYLTGSYWPVRALRERTPVADPTNLAVCLDAENEAYAAMEAPQANGECLFDDDCVVSGCSNEVCAPVEVATDCRPLPVLCSACQCLGNTCRWVQ